MRQAYVSETFIRLYSGITQDLFRLQSVFTLEQTPQRLHFGPAFNPRSQLLACTVHRTATGAGDADQRDPTFGRTASGGTSGDGLDSSRFRRRLDPEAWTHSLKALIYPNH